MTQHASILLVDDEEDFLRGASLALRMNGYTGIETCCGGEDVLARLERGAFSLVLLDVMMPDISGVELLPRIVQAHPECSVVMSTAVNDIDVAVQCMRDGAFDYLVKPIDKDRLTASVRKALAFADLQRENRRLCESFQRSAPLNPGVFDGILTDSENMRTMFRYIEAIAPTGLAVLILGETGSGKELVARAVHAASARTGHFVVVNAAGLDDTLFCDTLFGHERGAFTGADRPREGLVGKAGGGTLFLDEIGDLKVETQVKLLRLLEDGSYYSTGSDTPRRAECRIVVATNAELEKKVADCTFRKDLYFRLKSHTVRIPPLRERPADIPVLTSHFIALAARELGKPVPTPPPQLFTLLGNFEFPGNVRELRGMVFDAVSRHTQGTLSLAVFREHIGCSEDEVAQAPQSALLFGATLPSLRQTEHALVAEALRRCDNNQSQAAALLGITPSALCKRLSKRHDNQ